MKLTTGIVAMVMMAGGVWAQNPNIIDKSGSISAGLGLGLMDQSGRTGLGHRHSTTRVAVVPAAGRASRNLQADVADDLAQPLEWSIVAGRQIAE